MVPPLTVLATFVSITIATIGIVNSFVLAKFNERSFKRRANLSTQISAVQRRLWKLPAELLQQSVRLLTAERKNTEILTTRTYKVLLGVPPLGLFLSSLFIAYFEKPSMVYFQGFQFDVNVFGLS
jgi:hypothetical protein